MKTLRQAVGDYLSLRRGLGFKLKKHEPCLKEFVGFLKKTGRDRITTRLALQFATQHRRQQPAEWAARLSIVRGFARYRSGDDLASLKPWTYYVAPATGLHRCFQNEQARNIIRVAITTAEYLFELLRFGQLLQKILVDGGSEGGVEAHVAWG